VGRDGRILTSISVPGQSEASFLHRIWRAKRVFSLSDPPIPSRSRAMVSSSSRIQEDRGSIDASLDPAAFRRDNRGNPLRSRSCAPREEVGCSYLKLTTKAV